MSRKSIQSSAGEPSFFYLMMARSCFRRARNTRHPKGSGALRTIGRSYLAQASAVGSVLETSVGRLSEA
jgi:hypothetical protein